METERKILFDKICSERTSLSEAAYILSGAQFYEVGEGIPEQTQAMIGQRIYTSDHHVSPDWLEYVDIPDFTRYRWRHIPLRWVRYGECLADPQFKAGFREIPKLILRKGNGGLYVQRDNNAYIIKKGIFVIHPFKKEYINYFLGILNSRLISKWFKWSYSFGSLPNQALFLSRLRRIPVILPDQRSRP